VTVMKTLLAALALSIIATAVSAAPRHTYRVPTAFIGDWCMAKTEIAGFIRPRRTCPRPHPHEPDDTLKLRADSIDTGAQSANSLK
jgi:hypothetical protein